MTGADGAFIIVTALATAFLSDILGMAGGVGADGRAGAWPVGLRGVRDAWRAAVHHDHGEWRIIGVFALA